MSEEEGGEGIRKAEELSMEEENPSFDVFLKTLRCTQAT